MSHKNRDILVTEFVRLARARYGFVKNWEIDASCVPRRMTDDELAEEVRQLEQGAVSQIAFNLGKDRKRTPTTG